MAAEVEFREDDLESVPRADGATRAPAAPRRLPLLAVQAGGPKRGMAGPVVRRVSLYYMLDLQLIFKIAHWQSRLLP